MVRAPEDSLPYVGHNLDQKAATLFEGLLDEARGLLGDGPAFDHRKGAIHALEHYLKGCSSNHHKALPLRMES